jgi:phosphohistidine swiveling domain-containing protein
LLSDSDFYAFLYTDSHANFVGAGKISAECVDLQKQSADERKDLAGKIAMIPQADPGYDWLFGHGIAGLITTYGGANSHMAIRAAEFGLPAAIGVGEAKYEMLARASVLELDPVNKRIEVIR